SLALDPVDVTARAGLYVGGVSFVGVDVHGEFETRIDPHEHVAENKLAISRNAHAHERFIADSVTERIFRTHVNVPQRANNSAVDWDVPVRALQYATGRIGDVAAFAYWRMNAELELLGHRDLDLRVFARGSENTHAFDATFRSDDRELLFAS